MASTTFLKTFSPWARSPIANNAFMSTISNSFCDVSLTFELEVEATSNPSTLYADCSGFST